MKKLKDILYGVSILEVVGDTSVEVSGIAFDSRKVTNGFCYTAQVGTQVDGHSFIDKTIADGAIAIVCEKLPAQFVESVTYIKVVDSAEALGVMASNFYDNPSSKLKLVGVTGTNGKTTTASLLAHIFNSPAIGNIGKPFLEFDEEYYPNFS